MTLLDANGKPLRKAKPKRAAPQGEPVIETTHAENLAARKFLQFLVHDIGYQLNAMSRDSKVSRETFENSKDAALLLSNYLIQQIKELDRVIATVEPVNLDAALKDAPPASAAIN